MSQRDVIFSKSNTEDLFKGDQHIPVLVNGWEALQTAQNIGKSKESSISSIGKLSPEWFLKHGVQADPTTKKFPDNIALEEAPLSMFEDFMLILIYLPMYGFFIWIPAFFIALFFALPTNLAIIVSISVLTFIYAYPATRWPPALRLSFMMEGGLRYFSYRVVIERPINHATPAIYCMGPHGVAFALAPTIQAVVNEFLLGANIHIMAATAVFYVPLYNILLKMIGFLSVDRNTFVRTLERGESVGLVPGGIDEMFECSYGSPVETLKVKTRKGFVRIALETGAQIVPCYCFGNSQTFTSGSGNTLSIETHAIDITGLDWSTVRKITANSLSLFAGISGLVLGPLGAAIATQSAHAHGHWQYLVLL